MKRKCVNLLRELNGRFLVETRLRRSPFFFVDFFDLPSLLIFCMCGKLKRGEERGGMLVTGEIRGSKEFLTRR